MDKSIYFFPSSSFFCKAFCFAFSAINWSWITDLECVFLTFFKSFLVAGIFSERLTWWIASLTENKEIEIQMRKQDASIKHVNVSSEN